MKNIDKCQKGSSLKAPVAVVFYRTNGGEEATGRQCREGNKNRKDKGK